MKKLFFFRSSSSNTNGSNHPSPQPSADNEVYWEKPFDNENANPANSDNKVKKSFRSPQSLFSKSRKQTFESENSGNSSGIRRTRSLSSAAFQRSLGEQMDFSSFDGQMRSPHGSSSAKPLQQFGHRSSRCHTLTPKCQNETKIYQSESLQNLHEFERPGSADSLDSIHDLSAGSSQSSSVFSTKVVDCYIDGEQQHERNRVNSCSSLRNGNGGGKRPLRVHYSETASPPNGSMEKTRSNSFRESYGTRLNFASKDWTETRFGHESPRRLARNVIEKLSHCHGLPKISSKAFKSDIPITIEDVYGGSMNKFSSPNLDEVCENTCRYYGEDFLDLQKQISGPGENFGGFNASESEGEIDAELHRKLKEAKERVMFLSEELGQESFLYDAGFDLPGLVKTIRNLTEERISLAHEVSGLLDSRITDRAAAKEELRLIKADMDGQTRRLEREKNELQAGLERELDRRSSDWSLKLERYKSEEQRLRDRVRELAEKNVSLQREVSAFSEREIDSRGMMTSSEQKLKELTTKAENVANENQKLQKNLSELQEMYKGAEEDRDCVQIHYEEKDKECKDLHKSITRLLRTCSEQEKAIEGLREGICEELEKKQSVNKYDNVGKLQLEQIRLLAVEQALRKEIESYHMEVNLLRQENISLLNRLGGNEKEGGCSTLKLDQELWTRICLLQNQGLSLLNESTQACSKLLDFIKRKLGQIPEINLIEFETKVHGLKRGTGSLARSLEAMSSLLHEKSKPLDLNLRSECKYVDGSVQPSIYNSEDILKGKLKAETLLTSLLREKLYSKEQEVEQLQAELATAVRGNDILSCEVQNAMDNLSCASYKLKDFELKMLKKDENMSRMQSDFDESSKELIMTKGTLSKVSQERDMMWEEVKQYSEKNMLSNKEVTELKKKIETLDEAILVREGEMAILKDTLGKRPFNLLNSPDSTREFLMN